MDATLGGVWTATRLELTAPNLVILYLVFFVMPYF